MAKTYVDTVKYIVKAEYEIDGIVEKPDIIGAIFGQTEGLLGDQLDLRELQKSGRIGRIEVSVNTGKGKTRGEITLPSSLDRVETSILAAALETVDRIGPCEARIHAVSVEDTRTKKREQIVSRAKEILKQLIDRKLPESRELSELVRDEVKTAEVISWGPEKLAAGPGVDSSEEIIVVEGRADVLTLLKAGITNVISLQGKNIPRSVVDLSHKKTITLFVDGDRGGDLIVKNFVETGGEADFVTKAPDGKEVEELTQKEILKCLRRKLPLPEFMSHTFGQEEHTHRKHGHKRYEPRKKQEAPQEIKVMENTLNKLSGSLKAVLFGEGMKEIKEVPVKELTRALEKERGVYAVVMDGIVTQRLVDTADKNNVKYIVGVKQGQLKSTRKVEVYTAE